MKRLITLFGLVLMTISVSAQYFRGDVNHDGAINTGDVTELYNIIFGTSPSEPEEEQETDSEFNIDGVMFNMVHVTGGTFMMGATEEQGSDPNSYEKPAHSETVADFWIGETEVTQGLWQAVMGSNPSSFQGFNRPVENVSWSDCQIFISKLNSLLSSQLPVGYRFCLPTEAEWEYAARGGNKSQHYKYSGSDVVDEVAWYKDNSNSQTHDVKSKNYNELGICDMSGNVYEWCNDYWRAAYDMSFDISNRVVRSSAWNAIARTARVSHRQWANPDKAQNTIGLRLAITNRTDLGFTVGNVSFTMIGVTGGTFVMGATAEQGNDAYDSEKPDIFKTVGDFWIGETEVTQALWEAVMGSNPSNFQGSSRPVEKVSWNDCQTFVEKLNTMLADQLPFGRKFRLPTEAEWEYAARGGSKTQYHKYSGSDVVDDVAWYADNSGSTTHDVMTKNSNELGIYDMSGNVSEWCQDYWRANYSTTDYNTARRVARCGSFHNYARGCRVSYRYGYLVSNTIDSTIGLRLAL